MTRERVTVGIFEARDSAKRAIEDLRSAHFSDSEIGILTHDEDGDAEVRAFRELEGHHARSGAAVGAAAGAGGGALWALGIAAGVLPAIGPVIAGGLLVALAASAGAGAAAGLLVGTLVGLGVPDAEAAFYDDEFKKGRTIVVVRDDGRRTLAHTIFRAHGGVHREVFASTLAEQIESRVV